LEEIFKESIDLWGGEKIELVFPQDFSKRRAYQLKERLYYLVSYHQISSLEALAYPIVMENVQANFAEFPSSFLVNRLQGAFRDVPAVICGAGCSLEKEAKWLRTLEHQALIFAGGSTIPALGLLGVTPHFSVAIDPNAEEFARLKKTTAFETPFLYGSRVHKEVLPVMHGRPGYISIDSGGPLEAWIQEKLNLPVDALQSLLGFKSFSVTTLMVPLACYLGCNPLLFCGVDLSYQRGKQYLEGIALPSTKLNLKEQKKSFLEQPLQRNNNEGKRVYTLRKWILESQCLSGYIKQFKEVGFWNASSQGLPIKGARCCSLEQFIKQFCQKQFDLQGQIHLALETSPLEVSLQEVKFVQEELVASVQRCLSLFKQLMHETEAGFFALEHPALPLKSAKWLLLEMDLEQEVAFSVCFQRFIAILDKRQQRAFFSKEFQESEAGRKAFLDKKMAVWKECEELATYYLSSKAKKGSCIVAGMNANSNV